MAEAGTGRPREEAADVASAGWYRDPGDPSRLRWFDGAQWTQHTRAGLPRPLAPVPSQAPASDPQHAPFDRDPTPTSQAQPDWYGTTDLMEPGPSPTARENRGRLVAILLVGLLVAGGAVAAGLMLTSGDDASDVAAPEDPAPTDETVVETTVATVPPNVFHPVAEWEWTWRTSDGYITKGKLSLGPVSRAEDAPPIGDLTDPASQLPTQCSGFDAETDAVIPAEVTLTNGTSSFSQELSNHFYLATTETSGALIQSATDDFLQVDALYSSAPDCHSLVTADDAFFSQGEGWGLKFSDPAAPQQTKGPHHAMLILPDYFTPAKPSGDIGRLSKIGLSLVSGMRNDNAQLVSLTGPNTQYSSAAGALMFTSLGG